MMNSQYRALNRRNYQERIYDNQGFPALIALVGAQPSVVLDVGCGAGANLRLLKERGHTAIGLTLSSCEARLVERQGLSCRIWDITNEALPFPHNSFDALIFCHVLEHFAYPEDVLRRYAQLLRPKGKVLIALPNVMYFMQRMEFLLGRFRYTESGILDRTHLRFFDYLTARKLIENAGFEIERHFGLGQFPMGPFRELLPGFSSKVDQWISKRWPRLFSFHIIVIGRFLAVE